MRGHVQAHDLIALGRLGNQRLLEYVQNHPTDRDLLENVKRIVQQQNRSRSTAGDLVLWIDNRLSHLAPSQPSAKRKWTLLGLGAGFACALGAGVAHAVGADVWKWASPQLLRMLGF